MIYLLVPVFPEWLVQQSEGGARRCVEGECRCAGHENIGFEVLEVAPHGPGPTLHRQPLLHLYRRWQVLRPETTVARTWARGHGRLAVVGEGAAAWVVTAAGDGANCLRDLTGGCMRIPGAEIAELFALHCHVCGHGFRRVDRLDSVA